MDKHNISFFGKTSGMLVSTAGMKEPWLFIRMIKQKESGTWEKPSQQEGKLIRFSLEEQCMILNVLNHYMEEISGFHTFKDSKTAFSFKWKDEMLWINIGDYSKPLTAAQVDYFRRIMEHIVEEKIANATGGQAPKSEENTT